MSGAFRRFYLYSALSIAVLALAVAVGALLGLGLRALGVGPTPLSPDTVRTTLAFALATIVVATPVGAVHLALVGRGLHDPLERSADVRHFYLNVWILIALLVSLIAGESIAAITGPGVGAGGDPSSQIAAILVSAAVALGAWRWRRTTPPLSGRWEPLVAFGSMAVAMIVAAVQITNGVGALGQLWAGTIEPPPPARFAPPPQVFLERTAWSGTLGAAWALAIWAVGVAWQWPRRDVRVRLPYVVAAYAVGVVALLAASAIELSGLVRIALGRGGPRDVVTAIGGVASGVLLVGLHGAWLVADRRDATDRPLFERLLAAPVALGGLALLAIGAGNAWAWIVAHGVGLAGPPATSDPRDLGSTVLGTLAVALATYPLAWRWLMGRSVAGEAVRRFSIFTAMCLALLAGVITAAMALYSAISSALGVSHGDGAGHAVATNAGYALIAAAVFTGHLVLFLRERRERPDEAPRDRLMETLDAVARGELTPADAAARIRG